MLQFFLDVYDYLINIIFPRDITCVLCDRELFDINEGNLCNICMGSLQFTIGNTCRVCGRLIPSSNKYRVCNNCMLLDRNFDIGVSVLEYDDYSKKMFFDFKYYGKKYFAHTMAVFIKKKLIDLDLDVDIDCFVPVPLNKKKQEKRGFNQAELICKYLSELTGIKTLDCIDRIKNTRALNGLSPEERQSVLKGSFALNQDLGDRVIVLVDDIFTTGSTINTCSKLLKENGAEFIISACFGVGE